MIKDEERLLGRAFLVGMSAQDFRSLGRNNLAYIRPAVSEGRRVFSLHAADGTPLTVQDNIAIAALVARNNSFEPVSVH